MILSTLINTLLISSRNYRLAEQVKIDVQKLIESIYISPFASRWFVELVEDLACRYGLKDKNIYMSDIKLNK